MFLSRNKSSTNLWWVIRSLSNPSLRYFLKNKPKKTMNRFSLTRRQLTFNKWNWPYNLRRFLSLTLSSKFKSNKLILWRVPKINPSHKFKNWGLKWRKRLRAIWTRWRWIRGKKMKLFRTCRQILNALFPNKRSRSKTFKLKWNRC